MPSTQYEVFLAEHKDESFGKLVPLAILMTNPDTAGTVQAIGPLKKLAEGAEEEPSRFLIVTELNNPSNVVLRQSDGPSSLFVRRGAWGKHQRAVVDVAAGPVSWFLRCRCGASGGRAVAS
jgi:hypothetical protein